jgi:NAD(P)-dependent dehydrogenase (short-subunit alcohol dehydrogenase family)
LASAARRRSCSPTEAPTSLRRCFTCGRAGDLHAERSKAFAEVADVAEPAAIPPTFDKCVQWLGGLDGLALNVGVTAGSTTANTSGEICDSTFAVKTRGLMLFVQCALGKMAKRHHDAHVFA